MRNRTETRWKLYGIVYFTVLFALVPALASAYIDPSVTTYAIQAAVGVVMAVSAFFAAYGRRMRRKLGLRGSRAKTTEAPLEVTREDLREELRKKRAEAAKPPVAAEAREDDAPEKEKRPWRAILCCNLFLALTAAFFLPMEVVLLNQKEFLIQVRVFWLFQLLLSAGGALALTLPMMILPPKAGRIAAALSLGVGAALWAQSIFMNGGMVSLTGEKIRTTPAGTVLNILAWVLIIAAAAALAILLSRKRRKRTEMALCLIAGALTVMQAAGFAGRAVTAEPAEQKTNLFLSAEGEFTLSEGTNVIEFVVDTADEAYFRRMLERYPEMRGELSGWTWYSNTTSTYSRTYPSITYMLTGEKCWFDREYTRYVGEAFENSEYLPRLHAEGTDIRVYTMDPYLVGGNAGAYISNNLEFDYLDFRNLDLPHLEYNLMRISLYKGAPYALKNRFAYSTEEINSSSFDFPETVFSHVIDPTFYVEMQEQGIDVSGEWNSAYRFYHLFGLHPGGTWGEDLKGMDGEWDPVAALKGDFLLIRDYTDRMKALGIYDRATIIVTADHGISGGGEDTTLDAIYPATPLILVKYPDSDGGKPLEENSAPVCHDDLFATAEAALGAGISGTGSGKTLKDFTEGEDRPRLFYYTALYSDGDGEVALREYEITGDAGRLENWRPTGNWWNIDYSVNKVSAHRFKETENRPLSPSR